ncbi:MAG: hydrogenase maturation nickel metallochaperone HypA, partial [bacterium]
MRTGVRTERSGAPCAATGRAPSAGARQRVASAGRLLTRGEAEFQWASRPPGSLAVHERSLVRTLLRQVEEILQGYPRARVCRIHVSVGEFAGVEAALLEPAFEELTHATDLEGARLVVQLEPLEARCRSCHHLF